MKQQYVKTTVEIDPKLLYLLKIKALKEGITMKEMYTKLMIRYIKESKKRPINKNKLT